ncbi:MAG TPA: hypothetical protein VKM56_14620, partial [Verrucomicrobiae bacterium]|nr:hypothetical protein [Verrucomicrobiae bacterium]
MRRPKHLPALLLAALLALRFTLPAFAFEKPAHPSIPEIDKRAVGRKNQPRNGRQAAGLEKLLGRLPEAKV